MIEIAFCFDGNMVQAAAVAIASLLDFKNPSEHYRIHCICSSEANKYKDFIQQIVIKRDKGSIINFIKAPDIYDKSYEIRGITSSTYLRLLLHRILNDIDRVIYADVDVLFRGSLSDLWSYELGDCLIAGVKGANNFPVVWAEIEKMDYYEQLADLKNRYINAGILLMNLKAIRKMNPDDLWSKMAQKRYHYQDQDILNITCKGNILFLPLKYNRPAHLVKKDLKNFYRNNLYDKEDYDEALKNPIIIHYTGEKPWKNRGVNKAALWWNYIESQDDINKILNKKKVIFRKTTGIMGKINHHLPF